MVHLQYGSELLCKIWFFIPAAEKPKLKEVLFTANYI